MADASDVSLGCDVNDIQQYLRQCLIDEMDIAISPVLLDSGEPLFDGLNLSALGCRTPIANLGQPPIATEKIALSFIVWNNSPKLKLPTPLQLIRSLKPFTDFDSTITYLRDSAITKGSNAFPRSISEHDSTSVSFDLTKLIEAYIEQGYKFAYRFEFALVVLFLKIFVLTPTKKYFTFANYEIRYYLWSKYKNDMRLF